MVSYSLRLRLTLLLYILEATGPHRCLVSFCSGPPVQTISRPSVTLTTCMLRIGPHPSRNLTGLGKARQQWNSSPFTGGNYFESLPIVTHTVSDDGYQWTSNHARTSDSSDWQKCLGVGSHFTMTLLKLTTLRLVHPQSFAPLE